MKNPILIILILILMACENKPTQVYYSAINKIIPTPKEIEYISSSKSLKLPKNLKVYCSSEDLRPIASTFIEHVNNLGLENILSFDNIKVVELDNTPPVP